MRVFVESLLPCDAELAWEAVQTSALLEEVAAPLISLRPMQGESLPDRWPAGGLVQCRMYLMGLLPLGTHTLKIERIDAAAGEIQSRESDPLVSRWDHLVRIRPAADGQCEYSDEIEIEAGWRTVFVWLFAELFYRHRQARWRKVARRLMQERLSPGVSPIP